MRGDILIVDDEKQMRALIQTCLLHTGRRLLEAKDGKEAAACLETEEVGLVILDIMMPGMDGFAVLKRIRQEMNSEVPVMLLSALGDTDRIVRGLQLGADDYVVKPFEPRELTARAEAAIRRSDQTAMYDESFTREELTFYPNQFRLKGNGDWIPLTKKEYALFQRMALHPGRVYSREELLSLEWEAPYDGDVRTVDSHVKNIRDKLKRAGCNDRHIETVWGVGYRVDIDAY